LNEGKKGMGGEIYGGTSPKASWSVYQHVQHVEQGEECGMETGKRFTGADEE